MTPSGDLVDEQTYEEGIGDWLPTRDDSAFITEVMKPKYDAGEFASWIARPSRGVMGQPLEFEYVKVPG